MAAALHPFGFLGGTASARELRRLRDEMDRLMDGLAPAAGEAAMAAGSPAVNVYAGQDGIAVVAELPGVEKVDVELTWDPPWSPERMSEDAKFILGFG